MSGVSRLTAAPLAVSTELTAALGVLNFDFSLMKLEAPREYKALGAALSSSRRNAAEEGDIHTTARKLRSLFEQIIPDTPDLYRAYGVRASEIATSAEFKSRSSSDLGAFAEHVGIDGSSVWAAATSGPSAIAMHLLGCMLARIWPAVEATSIWEEMVLRRKQDLARSAGSDPESYHHHMAVKASVSRNLLANWDASARAWLRAADDLDRKKDNRQKKLHLIIDNVRVPVNVKNKTYESVIQAWTTAMKTMDRLIAGVPQSITDGSALLGLSAWHLYPDMIVLGSNTTEVRSNDPLFSSTGILTLGLTYVGRKQDTEAPPGGEEGIYWSLPLAHLRFYGRPVVSNSALSINHARLTLAELTIIALGSTFRSWGRAVTDYETAMRCLISYWNVLSDRSGTRHKETRDTSEAAISSRSWLAVLASAAQSFLTSEGHERLETFKLFNLGRRRDLKFLVSGHERPPALFGLCKPSELLGLLRDEDRISLLRNVAHKLGVPPESLVIRFRETDMLGKSKDQFHFASVCPIPSLVRSKSQKPFKKKSLDLESTGVEDSSDDLPLSDEVPPYSQRQYRWFTAPHDASPVGISHAESFDIIKPSSIVGPVEGGSRIFWCHAPWKFSKESHDTIEVDDFFGQFAEFALFRGQVDPRKPRRLTGIPFEFLFGDPDSAAVFCVVDSPTRRHRVISGIDEFSVEEVDWALGNERISSATLTEQALTCLEKYPGYIKSLKAFATAHHLFSHLEGATLPMSVAQHALYPAKWLLNSGSGMEKTVSVSESMTRTERKVYLYEPFRATRSSSFACIASFELGGRDVSSEGLQNVLALATGDSIYIAASLIRDPAESVPDRCHEIQRIRGSIGRAGIALMVPPERPEIREVDQARWRFVNHHKFDGTIKDCLDGVSLHLSFTGSVFPLDTGDYGSRDNEVYILETLISVHDHGEWVADLDILAALENKLLRPIAGQEETRCSHPELLLLKNRPGRSNGQTVSVDCWDEFLDFPEEPAVVRAHGNWLARLAFASASVQKGYLTLLLGPSASCWECADEERNRFRHKKQVTYLI